GGCTVDEFRFSVNVKRYNRVSDGIVGPMMRDAFHYIAVMADGTTLWWFGLAPTSNRRMLYNVGKQETRTV
ncbi:MAG: hypothetical protein NXI22_26710, partial [bacterium]|nr:hypothetical protein [bacterium]